MPTLRPVDDTFFDSAPLKFENTWSIKRPPADVWAEIAGDEPLSWCKGLSVRWTSPLPRGIGTTREASVLGAMKVQEYFYRWDEGTRYSFRGTSANVPLFAALAEDYVVEPDGSGGCTFTWKIAVEPTLLGKPGAPVNSLLFNYWFGATGKHFAS